MENSSTPDWKLAIVKAIAETIFPAFPEDAELARQAGKEGLARMMETSASSMDFVVTAVVEDMKTLTPEIQRELALLFFLLRTGPGTAVVGGPKMLIPTCPPMQSFARMSLRQREGILQYWATGPIPLLRKALKGLKSLVVNALFNATNTKGDNPLWEGIKYDGPDPERPVNPSKERTDAEAVLQRAILDLTNPPCRSPEGLVELVKGVGKIQGSKIHENVSLEGESVVIHTDVVVVGSGAGGGVTAALLAEAGAQVVVLEKGRFTPAAELSLKEREAGKAMYEMGTLLTTTDAGINILAGSTLGGGTRVNWQASFRTPEHVRQEWAHVHGLKDLISYRYTAALDAVCARVGVTTGILEHSKPNQKLKAGLEKLGVHCGEIPRNCSPAHTCGHCCFGCPTGDKQDMTGTYLSDAAGHGARIFTGVFVDKVLMEKCKDGQRKRQAVGVSALTTSTFGGRQFRLVIRAKYVVSSAGTLHTPALLLRSKISCRGNVGKNLRLHPATAVTGVFGEGYEGEKSAHPEPRVPRHSVTVPMPAVLPNWQGQYEVPQDIQSWKGSIFSIFSKHAANWNGSGYGPLLMTPAAHPGIIAASIPWLGGHDYKRLCTWFPYMGVILVLTRDRGSGRVTIGRDGLPRMHYWPNKHDQQSMMNGVILGLETLAAAGSYMVGAPGANPKREVTRHEPYRDEETEEMLDMPKFQKYLQGVRKEGIKKNAFTMFSAHQMGTSKMGVDPKTSVVDPEGQCWEVSNLYVADASIFPTSTGVNPMITVEAMSYMVAQRLAEKFRPVGAKSCPCCPKDSRMGQHAPHYRDFGPKVDMGPQCPRFAELIELEDRDLPVTAAEVPKVLPNLKI